MLPSIQIRNFKNIKNLDIPKLSQVNLITGKNNTSKTSLLEAIGMWASNMDFEWIYEMIEKRGELILKEGNGSARGTVNDFMSLRSLFHNREINYKGQKNIYIGSPSDYIEVGFVKYIEENIERFSEDGKNSVVGKIMTKLKDFDNVENPLTGVVVITKDNEQILRIIEKVDLKYLVKSPEPYLFHFIKPFLQEKELNGTLWDKITLSEKEDYVIEALKIIEPSIEKIAFIKGEKWNRERDVTAKMTKSPERVPLKSMGDGINRVLSIALALVNTENGYLLIDEFENGLHYSVQEKLWEVVFMLAQKLNVQVFATTHSEDCIRAFSSVTNATKYKNLGQLIRLERTSTGIKAVDFQSDELRIANENDIDIR